MQTGENEQALRKIIDYTRHLAVIVLILHFYFTYYSAFASLQLSHPVLNKILLPVVRLWIFQTPFKSKTAALLLVVISLIGTRAKKDPEAKFKPALLLSAIGLTLYYISESITCVGSKIFASLLQMSLTSIGFLMFIAGVSRLYRLMTANLKRDIFNKENETFPQEERLLTNEYSINLPAQYYHQGRFHPSWINIINPFRGNLILGTPGAGKSYFVIRHIITQHIQKGFSMLLYDFKFDDLSKIAYNALLRNRGAYKVKPTMYIINLEKIYHRSNPLEPHAMYDITDAMEAARTIMLGLNREWIKKQGDFFVESPINFVTALFWFLKKYKDGIYCTVPHAIELAQADYKNLFSLLSREPEIEVLINPFISAWQNEAYDQLEGQIASAKISLARLVSPTIYYVLTGNDFTLDINNPKAPKIVCLANSPQKTQVFGAVLSLYVNRINKLINRKDQLKSSLIFDEFPTIYIGGESGIDTVLATARGNRVSTTLAVQDYSQLKKDYGREQAEVIMNIVGNVISGQVTGDTAKQISERIGKINQQKRSITVNSQDISIATSTQLDFAVPASTIASLSSGQFVGIVADDPTNRIELKAFHNEIINDHDAIKKEEEDYKEIPEVTNVTSSCLMATFEQVKEEIAQMIAEEIELDKPSEDS